MSLRLQMLQVARLAPRLLEEAAPLVAGFLERQFTPGGGAMDRAGRADLYYTIFALAALEAVGDPVKAEDPRRAALTGWIKSFGDGTGLDFIHLGALARCRAALHLGGGAQLLERLEAFRTADGGYHETAGAKHGHAYGCFVALGAYQDAGAELPEPLRMVQCLKFLETPDGAWGNVRGMREGTVPATAAAVTLLHQLGVPVNQSAAAWLLAQQHEGGGWLAVPGSPMPDLLSTATALHALACLDVRLPETARERCLDFVDTLWSADGGFHGHWADDTLDAEYTFYGLLALGHLAT
jgi:prenyltransferase beta subunit